MKKSVVKICSWVLLMMTAISAHAGRTTYEFNVQRPFDAESPTVCKVPSSVLSHMLNTDDFSKISLCASWITSSGKEKFYTTNTSGSANQKGHWFTNAGIATVNSKSRCIRVIWDKDRPAFTIEHNIEANVEVGSTYSAREALILDTDTLLYIFNVTIGEAGSSESITTDQPAVISRKNYTDDWEITPVVTRNSETAMQQNWIQVNAGDKITLSAKPVDASLYEEVKYQWSNYNCNNYYHDERSVIIREYSSEADFVLTDDAKYEHGGHYMLTCKFTTSEGTTTKSYQYFVDVQEHPGELHTWPSYPLTYDFHTEYPNLTQPEMVHNLYKKDGTKANEYVGEWWSAHWGDNLNSEVGTDSATVYDAAKNMVAMYDRDFAYIRNEMGWPPDLSARNGYKSFIYIYGSGLDQDSKPNTEAGGYQGWINTDGKNYACVWVSYWPFARFRSDADQLWTDGEYQRNAMIHEGIHAIFSDFNTCEGAAWFHEGGNTWLQKQMFARRDGVYGESGYLDGGPFLAPHMPIECYSGWLVDGSYGAPNGTSASTTACNWRNYLGGVQYANSFPTVIANICGDGVIPWIWRYCKTRVLQGLCDSLGTEAVRDIVVQYRARQALFDLGGWDKSYRDVVNTYFGTTVKAETQPATIDVAPFKLTPYQAVEDNGEDGWLAPDTLTNPGWSGANFVPIHVKGDRVQVDFRPEDTNMRALLCYRTKDGKCYYGQPANCGTLSIDITDKPANGVVFCVVVNTDHIFTGSKQLKHHWDYRLRLGEGAEAIADTYTKWFNYEDDLIDTDYETGIKDIIENKAADEVKILTGYVKAGSKVQLELGNIEPKDIAVRIVGATGVVVKSGTVAADGSFTMPANLNSGLYVVAFNYGGQKKTFKVIVK